MLSLIFTRNVRRRFSVGYYCFVLGLLISPIQSQSVYQSLVVKSNQGYQYSPLVPSAQLISTSISASFQLCLAACHTNSLCRIFDYGALVSQQCRLFEGNTNNLGTLTPAALPNSFVGSIQITASLFSQYGQPCSSMCQESRYLTCNDNHTCECAAHTYWSSSAGMCLSQSPVLGASCQQGMKMCRDDLNYTCLQFNQCGPLSLLLGTTIIDNNTAILGSPTAGLYSPAGLTVYGEMNNESLIVADSFYSQLIHIANVDGPNKNVSLLARNWTAGGNFATPRQLFLDTADHYNLYVTDSAYQRVLLIASLQVVSPPPRVVAGITATSGTSLSLLDGPYGITMDSRKNLYVSEFLNNRVTRWAQNTSMGVLIAGTTTRSVRNDSTGFGYPGGIYLDEINSFLYVADASNHRIQRFLLNGTRPYNGTTVAGGFGPGSGSHQLYYPYDVWVSKRTGAIYIADMSNNRIQRWDQHASVGVTMAGSPSGAAGSSSTRLSSPTELIINSQETHMYVSDTANKRVQRFTLL